MLRAVAIGCAVRVVGGRGTGLALVALAVIEQRYRVVMAVLDGASVRRRGGGRLFVFRRWVHPVGGPVAMRARVDGRIDRTRRSRVPHRASALVEALVCELRRGPTEVGRAADRARANARPGAGRRRLGTRTAGR